MGVLAQERLGLPRDTRRRTVRRGVVVAEIHHCLCSWGQLKNYTALPYESQTSLAFNSWKRNNSMTNQIDFALLTVYPFL